MKLFNLEIYTPDRKFFAGEVESLIIDTPSGEMGIMFHTLPLVTILSSGVMKIFQANKWMEAANSDGFVRVAQDKVTIMAQMCAWPYEVDEETVNKDIVTLSDAAKKAQSLREYKIAKTQLAISLAKLKIKNHNM